MIIAHVNLGQIGVVGDQNGQALPVNAWTDSMNVRFTQLGIEKIAESKLRIDAKYLFEIFTTKVRYGEVYVFAASKNGLHVFDGDEWKFTALARSDDSAWQYTHWGDTVIFNCPDHPPQMFDWDALESDESAYFKPLPRWGVISTEYDLSTGSNPSFDTEARCQRLVAYKSQLVAVGVSYKEPLDAELDPENLPDESPEYEKTEIKVKDNVVWVSDTTTDPTYKVPEGGFGGGADDGVVGATQGGPPSWDYISPATLSVQQVVGASDGRYIAAELLNEAVIIYTATAAHALVFTGGQYVVQTRRLFQRGAAGRQCVVEFGGNHFVIDGDQLYIHDGSTATRVGEDMFDVEFFKRAINLNTANLCHDPENREIWIYFDTNAGRRSCIYSYATGTFGWSDGQAEGMPITYASRGYLPTSGAIWADMVGTWNDQREKPAEETYRAPMASYTAWADQRNVRWTDAVGGWEDQLTGIGDGEKPIKPPSDGPASEGYRWIDQQVNTRKPAILALTRSGIHQKEASFGTNRECWVERRAIDLDDAGMNGWVIKHLKQYHMQIAGKGKLGIRTGWADSALADPVWEKPVWLDETGVGAYQADMRTTGRYLSLRFEFKEMGEFRWANGYMDIEVSGRR